MMRKRCVYVYNLQKNIYCKYLTKAPRRGIDSSDEYHSECFCGEMKKHVNIFQYENTIIQIY